MASPINREQETGRLDATAIDAKWQARWAADELYRTPDESDKPNWYSLTMYPYPSGILHVGHWYAFVAPDAFARFKRRQGFNVLFPMGFDAFGLPAENAAIKYNVHPSKSTYQNIEHMRKQYVHMGASIDWERQVITCDPDYYHWNQWIFLRMLERGLAVPGQGIGLVVPERPNRAGERASAGWQHLRTVRRGGLQARPGAVVLRHYEVRRRVDRRSEHR